MYRTTVDRVPNGKYERRTKIEGKKRKEEQNGKENS
jgi:hypothetical protein